MIRFMDGVFTDGKNSVQLPGVLAVEMLEPRPPYRPSKCFSITYKNDKHPKLKGCLVSEIASIKVLERNIGYMMAAHKDCDKGVADAIPGGNGALGKDLAPARRP